MKVRYIVTRYLAILGRLSNKKKANFSQIKSFVENQGNGEDFTFSLRTFQRIIQDIEWIFHVKIKCDHEGFYYIAYDASQDEVVRLSQSFHLLNYQKHFENYQKHISYDQTCTVGQEYIYDIQTAIASNHCLTIHYKKFNVKNQLEQRIVAPYGLKESSGRWYLVANDINIDKIRVFGLDRIDMLEESIGKFTMPNDFNIESYFKHSIGVFVDEEDISEIIELKFSNKLSGYIKNLPIHHSQTIEKETADYIVVRLRAYINTELINELMKYSDDVQVLKPNHLKKKMLTRANDILKNNM